MQIVINLDEDVYKRTKFYKEFRDLNDCVATLKAIENGTVLPKHGRLIDADAFEKHNSELWGCDFIHPKYCDTLADIVSDAPTILEAWGNEE